MPDKLVTRDDWLALVREPIIDPNRPIVDPHHHLWQFPDWTYVLEHLWADTGSGHNIIKTVFLECGACYRQDGPDHLKPVGETEFVESIASESRQGGGPEIAGIVSRADLRHPELDEILDAHEEAAKGLFRGIRHALAHDPHPEDLTIAGPAPKGLSADDDFRRGMARLGERGYTYDSWHFHHQNLDFRDLAAAVPGTTLILDHFGTPLGVGRFADRDAVYPQWCDDIAAIAECPNVCAKLGGLAMPDNGFGFNRKEKPPTSDELVEAQAKYYHHTIKCFGPERCMFESNFPVDRFSISYHVLWNALKKIAAEYSDQEQTAMFHDNASRIYRL